MVNHATGKSAQGSGRTGERERERKIEKNGSESLLLTWE